MELREYFEEPHVSLVTEDEQPRTTRWYETRYTEVIGTWEDYERRVKDKLALHVAQTLKMNAKLEEATEEDGHRSRKISD